MRYREKLVLDYGEALVADFELRRWKVDPVKNWDELLITLTQELDRMI